MAGAYYGGLPPTACCSCISAIEDNSAYSSSRAKPILNFIRDCFHDMDAAEMKLATAVQSTDVCSAAEDGD